MGQIPDLPMLASQGLNLLYTSRSLRSGLGLARNWRWKMEAEKNSLRGVAISGVGVGGDGSSTAVPTQRFHCRPNAAVPLPSQRSSSTAVPTQRFHCRPNAAVPLPSQRRAWPFQALGLGGQPPMPERRASQSARQLSRREAKTGLYLSGLPVRFLRNRPRYRP